MIRVRYLASLRERLGRAEDQVEPRMAATVAEVWSVACGGEPLPPNILIAVNHEYAGLETAVHDQDEVAFLPPITGGCGHFGAASGVPPVGREGRLEVGQGFDAAHPCR